jgi:dipeptidyl aminopeptidase/acylaminoacyl peptidase
MQKRAGYESDKFNLVIYDRKSGAIKNLSESFAHWVGAYVWSRDSKGIYFSAEEQGAAPINYTDLTGKVFRVVAGTNDDLAATPDGRTLLFTTMSAQAPNEIAKALTVPYATRCVVDSPTSCAFNTESSQPVSNLNHALLSQVSISPLEPFWFTGANNDKVEGFLIKPPDFDPSKKYPLKFIVHGGPEVPMGDSWSYRWNGELFAADGYVVVYIHFHGTPGYGQKFIDAINGDWGGAPFVDLMKGLDYAEQHFPFIDKDRECALGASYGGWMIDWIAGHTTRFKCLVTHDGTSDTESAYGTTEELWFPEWEFKGTPWSNREMYRRWSPILAAPNFHTPTLVVHGQRDYRLDFSQGLEMFTTLQRLGVPSKMLYFPDEGHWVLKPQNSQLWYKTVNDWVDQWLKKP